MRPITLLHPYSTQVVMGKFILGHTRLLKIQNYYENWDGKPSELVKTNIHKMSLVYKILDLNVSPYLVDLLSPRRNCYRATRQTGHFVPHKCKIS